MEITNIYQFMGAHPWLTFFLFLIVGQTLIYVVKYVAVAARGWPKADEKDDDED